MIRAGVEELVLVDGRVREVQGGDSTAGMQALPVGKIIEAKVLRKDNQEKVQTCMLCE